jgi:hypothetical protein
MKFNINDIDKAVEYIQSSFDNEKTEFVEVKRLNRRRSINQNRYLHSLFGLFGVEYGYTIEEAKTLIKRNCPFMVYEKNGTRFLRNTRDLDSKQMTDFIDWFRNYSSMQGLYLPTSKEYLINRNHLEYLLEKNNEFL